MAFTANVVNSNGRPMTGAYVTASIARCDKDRVVVLFKAWTDSAARTQYPSAPDGQFARDYEFNESLQNNNPIDYAYQLAEASDEWPDATWNV